MKSQRNLKIVAGLLQRPGSRKWAIGLVIVLIGYGVFEPVIEQKLGISLPSITGQDNSRSVDNDASNVSKPSSPIRRATDLVEIGRDTYRTPAGLVYGPGSRHRHRIQHVMAHSRDEPNRPGQHGVFDANDQSGVLKLIDEVYEKAQRGETVSRQEQDSRTVYEVDLGRRIGFVGGQTGNRRNRPSARHVRLVVEGNRLITAFPFVP